MKTMLGGLVLALCLGTPAWAGKVDTADNMVKQAAKLGGDLFDGPEKKAKVLCICHRGDDGVGLLGFIAYLSLTTVGGPFQGNHVQVDCYVPTYDVGTGEIARSDACVSGAIGTFFELVK